jgi:hypothetical protein
MKKTVIDLIKELSNKLGFHKKTVINLIKEFCTV